MENDQEIRQSSNSRFVTIPGLCVLLFFAAVSIYFKALIIGAFLCFLFLICLASRLWSRGVLNRVRLETEPVISSCHAGEELKLKLKVRNFSFFPLVWLDVILPLGPGELARLEDDDTVFHYMTEDSYEVQTGIRERFVWILWQQEIAWEEDLRALRRGSCLITEARLMAGDGFGLSAQQKRYRLKNPFEFIVYPRLFDVDTDPFLRQSQEAMARSRGQQEDITILRGSRPYMPGDPVKRIDWRVLARSGRMEIKLFETLTPGCATFVLDISSFHKIVRQKNENGSATDILVPVFLQDEFETMISFIASCIQSIMKQGVSPALIIPSYKNRDAVMIFPEGNEEDETRCMEELAKITFEGRENDEGTKLIRFPWEEFWERSHECGDVYICSLNRQMAGYQELADELGSGCVHRVFLKSTGSAGTEGALYVDELMPDAFSIKSLSEKENEEALG